MSEINDTIRMLAATALDTGDTQVCLPLSDALAEAGWDDWTVRQIREMADNSQPWVVYTTGDCSPSRQYRFHPREALCCLAGRPTPAEEEGARKAQEAVDLLALHLRAVAADLAALEEEAADCYATRDVSGGYRARQCAKILRTPGIVHVEYRDLRGTPPAGHVWIRAATGGRWGKSRREKWGRKLTRSELEALLTATVAS